MAEMAEIKQAHEVVDVAEAAEAVERHGLVDVDEVDEGAGGCTEGLYSLCHREYAGSTPSPAVDCDCPGPNSVHLGVPKVLERTLSK